MVHASLFSGIGGFDLAAAWMGWDNAFNCEIDPFCRKILKFHFPNAVQYDDIRATDFTGWRGRIGILSGGFPCQPFSTAGKRRGTSDDRYLWPEMLRAIREIRPRWVVGENVRGIVSWSEGLVFEQVHSDLEAEGYEVQAFVLPACGVNAPHKRERTWFVAHKTTTDSHGERRNKFESPGEPDAEAFRTAHAGEERPFADTIGTGLEGENKSGCGEREEWMYLRRNTSGCCLSIRGWQNFPTQSPVCSRDDGFPVPMDGITFPKWRNQSIRAYGNAIVPQVAYRIFDTIDTYDLIW